MSRSTADQRCSFTSRDLAGRIVKELGKGFKEGLPPQEIDTSMTIRLTSLLKSVSIFKPPDGGCLSPAGEYNLRLGIMKELHPGVSLLGMVHAFVVSYVLGANISCVRSRYSSPVCRNS